MRLCNDTILQNDAKAFVFIFVEVNKQLGSIHGACLWVPLNKVGESFGVLKNCAQAADSETLNRVITSLNQVKKNINALNIKEMKFATLVAEDCVW